MDEKTITLTANNKIFYMANNMQVKYKIKATVNTKADISNTFAQLRKFRFKVFNFNSNHKLPLGIKDFVDFVIINKNVIVFVEVKIGADKFSAGQQATALLLQSYDKLIPNRIMYRVITTNAEAKELTDLLISKHYSP